MGRELSQTFRTSYETIGNDILHHRLYATDCSLSKQLKTVTLGRDINSFVTNTPTIKTILSKINLNKNLQ